MGLYLLQHRITMHTTPAVNCASMCSVPPKAEAEAKDGASGKADDEKEEKSKPWKSGNPLEGAVRDAKVFATIWPTQHRCQTSLSCHVLKVSRLTVRFHVNTGLRPKCSGC